jgi:hypothetical protein
MSFALTTAQVKHKTKTVTRRNGWKHLKVGDLIQPVVKCMGLKKGEKQELIGKPIRVVSISVQRLYQISMEDVHKEGFPHLSIEGFIDMYCKANKCTRKQQVTRIEYEYL